MGPPLTTGANDSKAASCPEEPDNPFKAADKVLSLAKAASTTLLTAVALLLRFVATAVGVSSRLLPFRARVKLYSELLSVITIFPTAVPILPSLSLSMTIAVPEVRVPLTVGTMVVPADNVAPVADASNWPLVSPIVTPKVELAPNVTEPEAVTVAVPTLMVPEVPAVVREPVTVVAALVNFKVAKFATVIVVA